MGTSRSMGFAAASTSFRICYLTMPFPSYFRVVKVLMRFPISPFSETLNLASIASKKSFALSVAGMPHLTASPMDRLITNSAM
ncbi:hypothetical protein ACFX2F_008944 [Malus domestica]